MLWLLILIVLVLGVLGGGLYLIIRTAVRHGNR